MATHNTIRLIVSHIHWMPLEISGLLTAITTNLKFGLLYSVYTEYEAPHNLSVWSATRGRNNWNFVVGILSAELCVLFYTEKYIDSLIE